MGGSASGTTAEWSKQLAVLAAIARDEQARRLLQLPEVAVETDPGKRCDRLIQLALGRRPSPEEVTLATAFLKSQTQSTQAWERFAQALLLTNEFVFVD